MGRREYGPGAAGKRGFEMREGARGIDLALFERRGEGGEPCVDPEAGGGEPVKGAATAIAFEQMALDGFAIVKRGGVFEIALELACVQAANHCVLP